MYIYVCIYVCMYVCIYVYMYICIYIYVCICIYICLYVICISAALTDPHRALSSVRDDSERKGIGAGRVRERCGLRASKGCAKPGPERSSEIVPRRVLQPSRGVQNGPKSNPRGCLGGFWAPSWAQEGLKSQKAAKSEFEDPLVDPQMEAKIDQKYKKGRSRQVSSWSLNF